MLGKTGAPTKAREMMQKAAVQVVIMYGSEIWVITDTMMTVMEGFHNSIARRITGITAKRGNGG